MRRTRGIRVRHGPAVAGRASRGGYNAALPPEFFDFVIVDECHRSIYELWSQVPLYFDAFTIGLTATPAGKTFGFFNQNLVMQDGHAEAVADGVNVDFDVYRIRTKVTEQGAIVQAGETGVYVDMRHRLTRAERLELMKADLTYTANQLDRDVVSESQIRTVLQQFREKVVPDAFPDRTELPKTLIFAKDDSHADDIVRLTREAFGQGRRVLPEDHLSHRAHQGHEEGAERRRHRVRGDGVGEDVQTHAGRDTQQLPKQLLPANRRHGGHDRHRH